MIGAPGDPPRPPSAVLFFLFRFFSGASSDMRPLRFLLLVGGVAALAACDKAETTSPTRPPLAGVRFINALPDTGAIDIRAIDQVEWSPVANALTFRQGTQYMPTQAGARHFRMFPTDSNPAITSQFFKDTTVTFEANKNYTVLVTGLARSKTTRWVVLTDDVPTVPAGQIAIRAINAATGSIGVYLTAASTDALPGTATLTAADYAASPYQMRAVGSLFARVLTAGSTTPAASATGQVAPTSQPGTVLPAAGVNVAGSAFSVMYFPMSVPTSKAPQTAAFQAPAAIFFVDKVPAQ